MPKTKNNTKRSRAPVTRYDVAAEAAKFLALYKAYLNDSYIQDTEAKNLPDHKKLEAMVSAVLRNESPDFKPKFEDDTLLQMAERDGINLEMWAGIVPDIFGYGMLVIAGSEDSCMKALRKEYRRWKKSLGNSADPETTFNGSFENFGGRVQKIETGKVYYDNFGE